MDWTKGCFGCSECFAGLPVGYRNHSIRSERRKRHPECNIDDMNPERYEFIMDQLFEAGVADASAHPHHHEKIASRQSTQRIVSARKDK